MSGYRGKISGRLRASLLLGVSTAILLTGCGWFDSSTPVGARQVRPGAEQAVPVSASLPSGAANRQYDAGITAVDETRGSAQIGSVVPGKGGQKAQQEELAKTELENDRKARIESERQLAARKAADAEAAAAKIPASSPAGAPPTDSTPPAAATPPATDAAPSIPPTADAVPPPAKVTTTAMPPPTGPVDTAPAAVAPAPATPQ